MNTSSTAASATASLAAAAPVAGQATISCHENEIPPFVEAELERLYGCIYSSLAHFRVYGGAEGASTYVVRKDGQVTEILLFRRASQRVQVINEWIRMGKESVARFADFIFDRYPSVNAISFHAMEFDVDRLPYPCQRFVCTDDSVVALPHSAEAYLASLGKATRKNIRRYLGRLTERHPSFRYRFYEGSEASERDMRAIIGLNRMRMANKNKVSGIDDDEAEKMLKLLRAKGFVGVATIDGELCAGALTYRFGNNYFSFVRAHDPRYDEYRLGLVGGYLLLSECIARGGREFHFMWGREEHKALLLGVQKEFEHLSLYRSRLHFLLDGHMLAKNAAQARLMELKRRLLATQDGDGMAWKLAGSALRALRGMRKA